MDLKHTKNVTIKKCTCGRCDQYFISSSHCDGRFDLADALLYAAAEKMLEIMLEIDEVYRSDKNAKIPIVSIRKMIEKATGQKLFENISKKDKIHVITK